MHVFTRMEHPYLVFDKAGKMLDHWGEGIFEDAHGICITPDDTAYFVDRCSQIVLKFNKEGRHRLTLGKRGEHSDTGYTQETRVDVGDPNLSGGGMPVHNGVGHPGDPFHHPTDVSVAPDGEIYVSDGYRNCRVHKYSQTARCSCPGARPAAPSELRDTTDKPNHFHTVHSVWEHKGKVYVADRENNRIQIFDTEGKFIDIGPASAARPSSTSTRATTSCTSPSSRTASASSTSTATSSAATAASAATTRASSGARTASGRTRRAPSTSPRCWKGARLQKFARRK